MSRSLQVLMRDEVAGSVTYGNGTLSLEYAPSYRSDGQTPLSTCMRPPDGEATDAAVRPWLWGLLPDDFEVLRRWARRYSASLGAPFDLLESPVGRDCAGAVRFVPDDELNAALTRGGDVEWLDETGVRDILHTLKQDRSEWLPRARTGEFSLAGAQAKTALYCTDDRWGIPLGATPSTHILKPAIQGFDDHDLNEHLCLDAAGRAGLRVARTSVARFGDASAIVVERYDRTWIDGSLVRVHQEDMCQALGIHPADKYQRDGGPSAAQIVDLLRRVVNRAHVDAAVDAFVDGLIWNWIIVGTDAHAKNYSLLLEADQVRLAPLYDIGSLLPYDHAHPRKWRWAMKYGGDYHVDTFRNPWPKDAEAFGIDPGRLHARVIELCERAPDCFRDAVAALPRFARTSSMPTRLTDAVAERAATCMRIVSVPTPD